METNTVTLKDPIIGVVVLSINFKFDPVIQKIYRYSQHRRYRRCTQEGPLQFDKDKLYMVTQPIGIGTDDVTGPGLVRGEVLLDILQQQGLTYDNVKHYIEEVREHDT